MTESSIWKLFGMAAALCALAQFWAAPSSAAADPAVHPNIVFILTDDQRHDAIGFLDPVLETPNMDRMAREGVHFRNAFVTTSLCSPSRASLLTGRYMHHHGIVDNNVPFPAGTRLFPQALQAAGYATAFVGKWHMGGHSNAPQPGFDHWVSFAGQGHYEPVDPRTGERHMLNVDGRSVPRTDYITDELNRRAIEWLRGRRGDGGPFFLFLSHKAAHANFVPADRHEHLYRDAEIANPATMADTPANYAGKPMWVRNQRNSWHGVDFPYHYPALDIADYRRLYYATLSAVDEGIGAIIAELEAAGTLENTLIVLMSDNGFMFGEHGLIDKRAAYEESIRVPLIAFGGPAARGRVVDEIVANIDIAPTFLALAGAVQEADFDGRSFAQLLRGKQPATSWRTSLLYEYYWEYNYPHTPTTFALRTDRYKLIQYHGVWDIEELYDLRADPRETRNLIDDPAMAETVRAMRAELFAQLDPVRGLSAVPFSERRGPGAVFRSRSGSPAAEFPERWLRDGDEPDLWRHLVRPINPDETE